MTDERKIYRSFPFTVKLVRRIQDAIAYLRKKGKGPQGFGEFLEQAAEAYLRKLEAKFNGRRPFEEVPNRSQRGPGPIAKSTKGSNYVRSEPTANRG